MSEYQFQNTNEYLKFIRENFRPVKVIQAGVFFQFNYFFHLNPLYKKYPEKKKYLDFFPLDLCLAVQPSKKTFLCINFHALPVATRQILIARLAKAYPSSFDESKPRIRIPGMNYRKMLRFLKKLGIAVRKYRFERVRNLSVIPAECIDTVMKFYANTYYRTNYNAIMNRYKQFRPKKP